MNYDASLFDESIFGESDLSDLAENAFQALVLDTVDRIDCVMAAGDITDLPAIKTWCESLPTTSYGQVFIEVFSPLQIEALNVPPRVGVTWICRELLRPHTRPGTGIERGEGLITAVDAWLSEWHGAEYGAERYFTMWMGARSNAIVHDYWKSLEQHVAKTTSDPRQ